MQLRSLLYPHAHSQINRICQVKSINRRIAHVKRTKTKVAATKSTSPVFGRCELDSHAYTIVAGRNCIILSYTGRECDVSPYRDDYEAVKGVPIVHAATAWQLQHTGQTYILVLNEALWMGDTMDHSLVNPNQLRHFGIQVQDDPMSQVPLSIKTEDNEFCMQLSMKGTIIFAETHSPTDQELKDCLHVHLSSQHQWNPEKVKFPQCNMTLEEHCGGMRYLSGVSTLRHTEDENEDEWGRSFSLESFNRIICSMKSFIVPEEPKAAGKVRFENNPPLTRDNKIDSGASDVPIPSTFQSTGRHSD